MSGMAVGKRRPNHARCAYKKLTYVASLQMHSAHTPIDTEASKSQAAAIQLVKQVRYNTQNKISELKPTIEKDDEH